MAKGKTRRFDVLTIFPETVGAYADASILGRAQKNGLIEIRAHDLRDWATDKHRKVDDSPYGGGPGMVMKVEPFEKAVKEIRAGKGGKAGKAGKVRVIMTAASGKPFTQQDAKRLAKYNQLIFLCGRYEGIDARVEEHLADESFSIGPYVLTGGELPALVMIDAIARNVPGVLGKKESLAEESHTQEGVLEYPQYTKPEVYKKWKVPEVLLSGNHKLIEEWRKGKQKSVR
jgi:tRNA (guanine37-N1)-methyltransferase